MKTSVIITTYNRPDALKRVLDALKNQTRLPDDVVIGDDGSGTDTTQMIHGFMNRSPYPLFHVWHEDKGFRAAKIRNMAIKKSNGDYLISLDGDCIPDKHFISDHLSLAERGYFYQGKRALVNRALSATFTHKDANSFSTLFKYFLTGKISNAHHIIRMPIFPSWTSKSLNGIRSCNMGFFKEDILSVNGFNQDFVGWGREDSELIVRLYRYGLKRKSHPFMAICYHLWHEENSRNRLSINDELLQRWIESDSYICPNGLSRISPEEQSEEYRKNS